MAVFTRFSLFDPICLPLRVAVELDLVVRGSVWQVMPFIARGHSRFFTMPLHCQEAANQKRTALERLWEEYHFGPLIEEALGGS